ncbi:hypothetical protein [uncultured Lutibacter sp.]|uniref:hypothetical protein n=1 Tax=uncultured Lutibacter sp. TaxID=437739 RepID=UPI00261EF702|nr:hypothetical protein [uncultured Lutibacter sp.]
MKNIWIIIVLLVVSCKSQYEVTKHIIQKTEIAPKNGSCTIELIPNKTIEFKTDNFGISYPIISDGENVLLKYTFKKNTIKNTQDGDYTEIIYAELNSNISNTTLNNENLQNVKLYFGRLCYCKGATGYYPITKGSFTVLKEENSTLNITATFKVLEVPQIISHFNESISLKSN